jgi:hypothetical protein
MIERRRLRSVTPSISVTDAMNDPALFGRHFRGPTWDAWRAFLSALFALSLTPEQLAIYQRHTDRSAPPTTPLHEAWLICGRRAGKSFILAFIATYLAVFKDWRRFLGPGEVGTVTIVCADRKQARVIKRYIAGMLRSVPMLAALIDNETRESIVLRNRVAIEIHTASFRSVRGYTVVSALIDELAYFPVDENASAPDVEIINAIRPALATVPDAMLLCASSPHARRGALWTAYQRHFGHDTDPVLVWQASTRDMNANVPQSYIDQHMVEDPERAQAEYLASFRSDLEAYVTRESVEACVANRVHERLPLSAVGYCAFCDPAGGSGTDSMSLAIAHYEFARQTVVVDAIREFRPHFSPEYVVGEFCALLKSYRINRISSDRYAGEWPREQFQKFAVVCEPAPKTKSDLYVDLLPLINSRRIDLLDHPRLLNQLISLERRTGHARDRIDHPPNQHDDVVNSVAGAATLALGKGRYNLDALAGTTPDDPLGVEGWRSLRLSTYLNSGGRVRL